MVKNKGVRKRKIIWYRLFIVVAIPVVIVTTTMCIVANIQKANRENTKVTIIDDGVKYELNANEFNEYKTRDILPTNDTIFTEEEKQELIIQDFAGKHIEDEFEYLGEFRLTGYCDCEECQEEWVGTTALGVTPTANHTIAVDPEIIPLGSHVVIDGVDYVAEDVGGMIKGNHIDIFVSSHEECYSDFCNKTAKVYLVVEGE